MKTRMSIIATIILVGIAAGVFVVIHRHHAIKHIVLISIDTCRADHLSCYGYPQKTTPNIDAFTQQATRFESVVTPVPITLPAHCSMLTGKIPPAHGVHENAGYQLAGDNQTLAEILKSRGFTTGAIVSSFVLDHARGLNQGFDTYNDRFVNGQYNRSMKENVRRGDETTRMATHWLEWNQQNKSFLFLHYYDAHRTYDPPEPYATKFSGNPYAGEIAFVDHCIGQVIQKLKELKMYDSTLLIVTGDHGEMLGEHGEDTHSYFVYESAIKVPLVIRQPGQTKGIVITQPVGLIDIVPTICSLLKIDPPSGIQGRNISPMLHDQIPKGYKRFLYSESVTPTHFGGSTLMSISAGKWKYIQAPRPELYNIATDPHEAQNLVKQEPQRARILADKLKQTLEQTVRHDKGSQDQMDAESLRRLESLGYVTGKAEGKMVFDENQKDPKDLIHIYTQFHRARHLVDHKQYAKAQDLLEALLPLQPRYYRIYVVLGDLYMQQLRIDDALGLYRQAIKLAPDLIPDKLYNNLAWTETTDLRIATRDVNEALGFARIVCEHTNYQDPLSLDTLATAYAATGNFTKAIEMERKACALITDKNMPRIAEMMGYRLKLFEQSKPFVEKGAF